MNQWELKHIHFSTLQWKNRKVKTSTYLDQLMPREPGSSTTQPARMEHLGNVQPLPTPPTQPTGGQFI